MASLVNAPGCRLNSLPPATTVAPVDSSFYGRMGDSLGVSVIMDSLLSQVRADPAISHYFTGIDTTAFKIGMAAQLCQWVGGPCTYAGPSMDSVHRGLDIDTAQFNAFISDYLNAMNSVGVADSDQNRVLTYLVSYENEIVGK